MRRCGRRGAAAPSHLLVAVEKVGAGGVVFAGMRQAFISFLLAEVALPPRVTNTLVTLENNKDQQTHVPTSQQECREGRSKDLRALTHHVHVWGEGMAAVSTFG